MNPRATAAAGSRSSTGLQNLGPGLGRTLGVVGFGLSALSSYTNDTQHTGGSRVLWAAGSAGVSSAAGWAGASAGAEAGTVICAAGGPGTVAVCASVGAFAGALGAAAALTKIQESLNAPAPGSENTKKLKQRIADPFKNGSKITPIMTTAR